MTGPRWTVDSSDAGMRLDKYVAAPGRGVSHNARTVSGQSAHDTATRIVWRITARRTSATRTSHALYQ